MPIVVDVNVKSGQAQKMLNGIPKAIKSLNDAVDKLNKALANTAQLSAQTATNIRQPAAATRQAAVAQKSYGGSASSRAPRSTGKPPDPWANSPVAGMNYYRAQAAAGNPIAGNLFAKYHRQNAANQRNQQLAQGNGPNPQMQAFMRTRFASNLLGKGGQILGVDLLKLGGSIGGGGAGAGGAAAMGAVAAPLAVIAAFALTVKAASDSLKEWSKSLVSGGGTPGSAQQASLLGNILGLNPAGLGQGLTPIGAAMTGVNPNTGAFGDIDYNGRAMKFFKMLDNLPDTPEGFEKARRLSIQATGSPDAAGFNLLSPEVRKKILNSRTGGSMKDMRAAADASAQVELLKNSAANIAVKVGGPWLRVLSSFFDKLSTLADKFGSLFDFIDKMRQKIYDSLPAPIKRFFINPGIAEESKQKALKDNTQALDNVNKTFNGIFGGGPRAQSAQWRGYHPGVNPYWNSPAQGIL